MTRSHSIALFAAALVVSAFQIPETKATEPTNLCLELLLSVDFSAAERADLEGTINDVRDALRDRRIGYTGLTVDRDVVVFKLRESDRIEEAKEALNKIHSGTLTIEIEPDGQGSVKFNQATATAPSPQLLERSIEVIRRRLEEVVSHPPAAGNTEPSIRQEPPDRILVLLPPIEDADRLKALLQRPGRLSFQLVDTSVSIDEARRGRLPPGDEILRAAAKVPGRPDTYLVKKRPIFEGDRLIGATPTIQSKEPVVAFELDAVGAKLFGEATRDNLGKPIAIVLDKKVLSAPVIREPILAGKGIISGSFTARSANDLALLLRAGALPAPVLMLRERTTECRTSG